MLTPGTVVWASNSTTVALEAAVLGLAVMVQMPADDVDLCPLQGVPGVARIASVADAAAFLAAPAHADVPEGYLALEPALPRWRRLQAGGAGSTGAAREAESGRRPGGVWGGVPNR